MSDYWRMELRRIADRCAETPDRVVVSELRNAVFFIHQILKESEPVQLRLEDADEHHMRHRGDGNSIPSLEVSG